jgi:hypothetical protein
MHTVIVLAIGFGLLAVCAIGGRFLGVKKAGYSVGEELPMFLLVFSVPAAAALLIWWKLR